MAGGTLRFSYSVAIWLPALLACLLVLCQSQDTGGSAMRQTPYRYRSASTSSSRKNALTEPGVIGGIVVGVVGVIVAIGVTIVLCKILCCKESSCCKCCRREVYREMSTSPLSTAKETNSQEHKPISIISQDRRHTTTRNNRPGKEDTPTPSPPEYDDLPQFDWKLNDVKRSNSSLNPDSDSHHVEPLPLPSNDNQTQHKPKPKKRERTSLRGKKAFGLGLSRGEGNTDTSAAGKEPKASENEYRKYSDPSYLNDTDRWEESPVVAGDGKEYTPFDREPRRRHHDLSYPDSGARGLAEHPDEADGGRESSFLELGPHKQNFGVSVYPEGKARMRGDNPSTVGGREFSPSENRPLKPQAYSDIGARNRTENPVEFMHAGYEHQYEDAPNPDDRARMWDKHRKARDYGEEPFSHAFVPLGRRRTPASTAARLHAGTDNQAYNEGSTETEV